MEESQGITKEELSMLLSNSSPLQQTNHLDTIQSSNDSGFRPRANRKRKKASLITKFFNNKIPSIR